MPEGLTQYGSLTTFARESWMREGNCRHIANPQIMFPEGGLHNLLERAKRVCDGCPVQAECLNYALEHNIVDGVWGGLSEKARLLYRRRVFNPDRQAKESSAA